MPVVDSLKKHKQQIFVYHEDTEITKVKLIYFQLKCIGF